MAEGTLGRIREFGARNARKLGPAVSGPFLKRPKMVKLEETFPPRFHGVSRSETGNGKRLLPHVSVHLLPDRLYVNLTLSFILHIRDVSLEYMRLSSKMARDIVEILLSKLGVEAHESIIERIIGLKTVNMNYYPACPNPELTVGVGRHSDIGTITVLLQDGIGGLYVKLEDDNPQWLHIPPIPGALVINIGDTLQILSNGKYKSPEHRVKTTSSQSRVSVPVFLLPIPTEKIGPLAEVVKKDGLAHYKEVLVKDYMNNFFASVHLGKKSLDFARI
ncbi:hypothetical protein RJT34_27086 [Clitoria ternatea]|uniref:Fe2OG dioxygenase domain-containing protein n=1 Tax=Clitoria ternatea TaxID=43366 RepID=A0AAN9FC81_CLITE